ncbi:uncharacterized protein DUF3710 [Murinocardiopsis flavida]|uniref:Uncharacterized protein DUF3710 n=1 Tax=Murinocardiopsis flavida TaxID=645275 RepID=A0A2P8CGV0_9ACTN|nr:DUF3710 domain-containing protein [Murinocardiopsis flavida]PSK84200.1 uncharacterized protein DUF3710 [Murinocardiopsis flavida]
MFGRRRKKSQKTGADGPADHIIGPDLPKGESREPVKAEDVHRATGPWDVSEDYPETNRVDLGGLHVPVAEDLEVQVNVAQQQNKVIGVTIVAGPTALQVQPFAAPKLSGLWDEVRAEIAEEITEAGGKSEEFEGTFGTELRAIVAVPGKTNEQGHQLGQPARFIGVDGPRWFLRGVIRGEGAMKPEAAERIEEVFAALVVVRGDQPVPPRDLLDLKLPAQAQQAMEDAEAERLRKGVDPGAQGGAGAGTAGDDRDRGDYADPAGSGGSDASDGGGSSGGGGD